VRAAAAPPGALCWGGSWGRPFVLLARPVHGDSGRGGGDGVGGEGAERYGGLGETPAFFRVFQVQEVVDLVQRAHGRDVCVIDLRGKPDAIADHFVLVTGMTKQHLQRIARGVLYVLKQKCKEVAPGLTPRIDGEIGSEWVAVDAGSIIVHVMLEGTRAFYDIEGIHGDSSNTEWFANPDLTKFK